MANTVNQLYILCASAFSGIIAGVLYEFFYLIRRFVKLRALKIFFDVLFFFLFAAIFIFVSVVFDFPKMRLFMIIGAFLGFFIYNRTFHRIVAFLIEKLYNKFKILINNLKKGKESTNVRRKN